MIVIKSDVHGGGGGGGGGGAVIIRAKNTIF